MNLKFRLAFLYSFSVLITLLASALSIFFLYENFRKEEFYKRLVLEGSESIQLFYNAAVPFTKIVEGLNRNAANSLPRGEIYIFDSTYKQLYSSKDSLPDFVSPGLFHSAKNENTYYFFNKGKSIVVMYRKYHNNTIYVAVAARDVFGLRKSDNLKLLLSISIFVGLILSGFLAFFYVRHAMNPLEKLKRQIETINGENLKQRIPIGKQNSEVWQIAKKFNAMLERLEHAFEQRKNFVQHASHELRTPLANMLSQTESALNKDLVVDDYRNVLISLKEDQQNLIDLTNSLLTLSRYEKITLVEDWTVMRIDEVIYQAAEVNKQVCPKSLITVNFEKVPANEKELEFNGNESLIGAAIQNLIKNAVNYSTDNRVTVTIIPLEHELIIHFDNTGQQLTENEKNKLFIPFFRGENSIAKKGYGLGLSIVQRIIQVHKGKISYITMPGSVNRFSIHLPK